VTTLWLAGCLYGFAGGGLPDVKTVAILPFENDTPEPALTQQVSEAVREACERRLGLRVASEANADALVRGRITRYEPGIPTLVQPGQGRADVNRRRLQILVDVEIVDQRDGKTLWKRQGLMVDGEYDPGQELQGQRLAVQKLVNEIVDGAQSQW
jgi:Lipopolysaccharide-assembly